MFFPNLDVFKEACVRCKLLFQHGRTSFRLNADNLPNERCYLPADLLAQSELVCQHAVSTPDGNDQANEIGIFQRPDGWLAVWDTARGGGGLVTYIGSKGQHLQLHYLVEGVRYVGIGHNLRCQEVIAPTHLRLGFYPEDDGLVSDAVLEVRIDRLSLHVDYKLRPETVPAGNLCACLEKCLQEIVMSCRSSADYTSREAAGVRRYTPSDSRHV